MYNAGGGGGMAAPSMFSGMSMSNSAFRPVPGQGGGMMGAGQH